MQPSINAAARSVGEVVGGISVGLSHLLGYGVEVGRDEDRQTVRNVRSRLRSRSAGNRLEEMYAVLGRRCYRISGRQTDFLREKRIQGLIRKIENYQGKLEKIDGDWETG